MLDLERNDIDVALVPWFLDEKPTIAAPLAKDLTLPLAIPLASIRNP
jgi:hypothetical protein